MAISGVNTNSLADMMLAQMKDKEKKAQQEGGGFAALLSGGAVSGSANNNVAKAEATSQSASLKKDAREEFLEYMKKTPAERMQEAWLKAHGITKEEFEAMPPEEKQAITDQMKQEIEDKLQKQAETGQGEEQPKLMIGLGFG
jgi:hypothetical protein